MERKVLEAALKPLFSQLDAANTGRISVSQMAVVLRSVGENLSDFQVQVGNVSFGVCGFFVFNVRMMR